MLLPLLEPIPVAQAIVEAIEVRVFLVKLVLVSLDRLVVSEALFGASQVFRSLLAVKADSYWSARQTT